MEELLIAILAGLAAGALLKKISDKAKSVPVFKDEKINSPGDILAEAKKARDMGADSACILLAFGAIESRLREISGEDSSAYQLNNIITSLTKSEKIPVETANTIRQLANIRNETAHGDASKKLSSLKVNTYIEKTESVLSSISSSTKKQIATTKDS